jgi:hypothetical protein
VPSPSLLLEWETDLLFLWERKNLFRILTDMGTIRAIPEIYCILLAIIWGGMVIYCLYNFL